MHVLPRCAAVLMYTVALMLIAACANTNTNISDFGEANIIDLSDGALTPRVQVEGLAPPAPNASPLMDGHIGELGFASLLDNSQDTFASHLNKPLVVNFFAAWCGPCRAELPDFEAVYQEFKDRVNFIGISRDSSADPSLELLADTGVSFPTGWDNNDSLFEELRLFTMPATLFVNRDGFVVEQWSGVLTKEDLRELIMERLL